MKKVLWYNDDKTHSTLRVGIDENGKPLDEEQLLEIERRCLVEMKEVE